MNKRFMLSALLLLGGTVASAQELPAPALPVLPPLLPPTLALPSGEPTSAQLPPLRGSVEPLLWWIKKSPVDAPLATTGNPADPIPGALDQPGTQSLFPPGRLNYGQFVGLRLGLALQVKDHLSVEGSLFFLEQRSVQFQARSDANGFPLLANPVFLTQVPPTSSTQEQSFLVSSPTGPQSSGSIGISSHSRLSGADVNAGWEVIPDELINLVLLAGLRTLDLNEDLQLRDQSTLIDPRPAGFLGQPLAAGSVLVAQDRFQTVNHFYGGQVGARMEYRLGCVTFGLQGKVAFGTTQEQVVISGSSMVAGPLTVSAPGGIYAQVSNIGRHYQSAFSIVPEGQARLEVNVVKNVRASLGYTFLSWDNMVRPGQQIDRTINPALVPTSSSYGTGGTALSPAHSFQTAEFWVQGLTIGVECCF